MEEGSNTVEITEKTLAQLSHFGSRISIMQEDDDSSSTGSYPITLHNIIQSRINVCENPSYSLSSATIIDAMMTNTSYVKEQLRSLTRAIEGLSKYVQESQSRCSN